jgi:hypothetical protein
MPIEFTPHVYYEETDGPIRNGFSREKPAIEASPALLTRSYEVKRAELLMLAVEVLNWGHERWKNDHGSLEDHRRLIDFITLSLDLTNICMPTFDIGGDIVEIDAGKGNGV